MRALIQEESGKARETSSIEEVRVAYEGGANVWVDYDETLPDHDSFLSETFGLHSLVLEDIWADRSLPKTEDFGDYVYVLVHGVRAGSDATELELVELDIAFGSRFVVTHHHGSRAIEQVFREVSRSGKLLRRGPAWVVHGVLDHLIDHYLPILEEFDEHIEQLEQEVLAGEDLKIGLLMERVVAFRRSLLSLRRTSSYQKEVLLRLTRGDFDEIPAEARPFFRDVYDHFADVTSLADVHRESLSYVLETYLGLQSHRMNEVMKALTIIATVMLPLTFIAGVYGMNFDYMPELRWHYGYFEVLAVMGVVALAIVLFMRHKRWV